MSYVKPTVVKAAIMSKDFKGILSCVYDMKLLLMFKKGKVVSKKEFIKHMEKLNEESSGKTAKNLTKNLKLWIATEGYHTITVRI
jgi:hypothetical protein